MNSTRRRSDHAPRYNRDPLLGTTISEEFEVLRGIGSGSHADVFLAKQLSVGSRHVALKVLCQPYLRLKEADFRRAKNTMLREGKLTGALRSPCFAEVYCAGTTDDDRPYIAMEYVHGATLTEAAAEAPLALPVVVGIVRQLADGLSELHTLGYVHRDITPSNILLRQSPSGRTQVKLIDLGTVTKVSERADRFRVGYDMEHPLGTAAYMAPEQARGTVVDGRADQFAVAACLYEVLTGQRAFSAEGHGVPALLARLKSDRAIPEQRTASLRGDVGAAAEAIDRALAIEPDDRYPTMKAFADAFAQGARGNSGSKTPLLRRLLGLGGES